jgi:hypothetical protein
MIPKLPAEILLEVFGFLTSLDRRECLLVCQRWYHLANEDYNGDIKINLRESKFDNLLKDLKEFPLMAPKIKSITLTNSRSCDPNLPTTLVKIINLCCNLSELTLDNTFEPHQYLKALDSQDVMLPKIQKIDIMKLYSCSKEARSCHTKVNLKFHETISHLCIAPQDDLEEYGGIVEFISIFKNLKYLKVTPLRTSNSNHEHVVDHTTSASDNKAVDLTSIIENHKNLEVIKLYSISGVSVKPPTAEPLATYSSLKSLKIMAHEATFNFLQYVMDKFKNLNSLRFVICTPLAPLKTPLADHEHQTTMDRFKEFQEKMHRVWIRYDCYGQHFYLNKRGDEEWLEMPAGYSSAEDGDVGSFISEDYDDLDEEDQPWYQDWMREREGKEAIRTWVAGHMDELFSDEEENESSMIDDTAGEISEQEGNHDEEGDSSVAPELEDEYISCEEEEATLESDQDGMDDRLAILLLAAHQLYLEQEMEENELGQSQYDSSQPFANYNESLD